MRFSIIALALLATVAVAVAHHSTVGIFDPDNYVEIEGVVTEAQWRNPHASYTVAVADTDGETVEWAVETGSITTLRLRGVDPGMIEVGDQVRFAGDSSTRGLPEMFARNLLSDNGQEVLLSAGSSPRWPAGLRGEIYQPTVDERVAEESRRTAEGIFRVWVTVLNDSDSFPLYHGGGLSLTESAETLKAQYDPTDNPYIGCAPRGMPYQMTTPYPFEFGRRGNDLVLHSELYDAERVIYMNTEPSATEPYSLLGYSVGRWEGDSLVVETSQFRESSGDLRTTAGLRVVERFSPIDSDTLRYQFTVDDPRYTAPWTGEYPWPRTDGRLYEYACHEGNYAMGNIMRGARMLEADRE